MDDTIRYEGLWWLPDNPDKKVAGILQFNYTDGGSLELIGEFLNIFERVRRFGKNRAMHSPFTPDIILGITTNSKKITLYKCMETQFGIGRIGNNFKVNVIFEGYHFTSKDDITFKKILVNYANLDSWANFTGFDILLGGQDDYETTVKYKSPKPILLANINSPDRLSPANNFSVSLYFKPNGNVNVTGQKKVLIEQNSYIDIEFSTEADFDRVMNIIWVIGNFFSLATMNPSAPLIIEGQVNGDNPFIKIYRASRLKKIDVINPNEMLFIYDDIANKSDLIFNYWFSKNNPEMLGPVFDLYFGTLYDPDMYLDHQFLSLAQAIESYHSRMKTNYVLPHELYYELVKEIVANVPDEHKERVKSALEFANRPSLRKRLKDIQRTYKEYVNNDFISDDFIAKVSDNRNYLTHHDIKMMIKASDPLELYNLSSKLRTITEMCILNEIGFSVEDVRDLFSRNNSYKDIFTPIHQ